MTRFKLKDASIGKVVEWSITAVLKTAVLRGTGGSNPSLSAEKTSSESCSSFFMLYAFGPVLALIPPACIVISVLSFL